jgi:polysaccharide biosynthesis/export protein
VLVMKISVTAPLSLAILLSTVAAAPAQSNSSRPTTPAPRGPAAPAQATAPETARAQPSTPTPSPKPAGDPAPADTGAARSSTSATTSPDYRLVPGDKLRIEVYRDTQLSQALQVRPDGKITLPLVGDVTAEGRTSTELRDALVSKLKEYNTNPVVTVIVVETVPPVFYVMGEVNSPGTLPIKGQVSVLQGLAMAGGFKDFAKTKDIKILRKGPAGTTTLKFNYKDAVKGEVQAIYLQPGDTIIVP